MNVTPHPVGGAGMTHIFTHHITSAVDVGVLKAFLPNYRHFDQRALLLARAHDVVCILGRVEEPYREFLSSLGIGPGRDHLVELAATPPAGAEPTLLEALVKDRQALEKIRALTDRSGAVGLHPHCASVREFRFAATLESMLQKSVPVLGGNPEVVAYANRKHRVHAKAQELGIPLAPGEVVGLQARPDGAVADLAPLEAAIRRYLPYTGKVIIRGTDGASGFATLLVDSTGGSIEDALRAVREKLTSPYYLVQVRFDIMTSPNIQLFIEPRSGAITCAGITDQCLNENLGHYGNVFPSGAKTLTGMLLSAETFARWLQRRGYTGLVGFDFVEHRDPKTRQVAYFLAEVNARTNAATYPVFLTERLNAEQRRNHAPLIRSFLAVKVTTPARSFRELHDLACPLFFRQETGRGLIPYNTGCLESGECEIVFLGGSREEVVELHNAFTALP
jgi:hypothetical protein